MTNRSELGEVAQRTADHGYGFGRTMTHYDPPERTEEGQERYDKLVALRRRRIFVPQQAFDDVERTVPRHTVREWSWYADVWPCPNAWNARDLSDHDLQRAQARWDTSETHVKGQREALAELEAKKAADAKAKADAETARRAGELDQLKADMKARYLQLPGTTEAEFEADFPQLLADERRRQMADSGDAAREAMRQMTRRALG